MEGDGSQAYGLLFLGILAFLPGYYETRVAYYSWRGAPGLSSSSPFTKASLDLCSKETSPPPPHAIPIPQDPTPTTSAPSHRRGAPHWARAFVSLGYCIGSDQRRGGGGVFLVAAEARLPARIQASKCGEGRSRGGMAHPRGGGGAVRLPPMNAMEILRETVRVLRADPHAFTSVLFLLLCPASGCLLLSAAALDTSVVLPLARRLLVAAASSGLPLTHFVRQLAHHLAATLVSAVVSFPALITLLLAARAAVAYTVAAVYAGKPLAAAEVTALARRAWPRLAATYSLGCAAIAAGLVAFLALLVAACSALKSMLYPPDIVVLAGLFTVLAYSVVYAHTVIVCNLGGVIAVLEDVAGPQVKTLSYGDGSSRLWEGPLLVLMYSFVMLVDSMMSAVFYFTCRSSNLDFVDEEGDSVEELEMLVAGNSDAISSMMNGHFVYA
ncbi:hypothetical protein PR202_ga29315 [Eleusine coracana subsp. coracana]|uniref:Uncharacterized protein n=1 Tax=Eleusine coracana subsp. coracana TaxID=191504 RepID=A0AAV5DJM0_ELECO|nr:hypothetical protein PR202_ga29315 [Eleusine coracana subsp. coracana]